MRSVSQIYAEAIKTRNDYLQLTELDSGRSESKLSIMNLLTYVMAVCIYSYEAVLEAFEVRIALLLSQRINGTPQWYAVMAKMFQYNNALESGDELYFDSDTLKISYRETREDHRIIEKSAWQDNGDGKSITLKVAKSNTNENEINNGTPYMQLSESEMSAFREFIQNIKFIGADIWTESMPGDIIIIEADAKNPIYYNDNYTTAAQALQSIRENMVKFAKDFEFNGILYYQSVIDVIRKTDNIVDMGNNIRVYVKSWDMYAGCYREAVELNNRMRLRSGYIKLLDEGLSTINAKNITLTASSAAQLSV